MTGVPIFPTGIIRTYKSPTKFSEEFDPKWFKIQKYDGSNKYRSEKFICKLKTTVKPGM